MQIPNAFSDVSPSTVVFSPDGRKERLYVVLTINGHMKLVSTSTPEDPSSWESDFVPQSVLDHENNNVSTRPYYGEPNLSVSDGRLWLIFTNSDYETMGITYTGNGWEAYGPLGLFYASSQTACENWIAYQTPYGIEMVRHSFFRLEDHLTVGYRHGHNLTLAFWTGSFPSNPRIVFTQNSEIYVTYRSLYRDGQWHWRDALPIAGSAANQKPALTMHGDMMYLAYTHEVNKDIRFCIHNGRTWIKVNPGVHFISDNGPCLISFKQDLYLFYVQVNTGKIIYTRITDKFSTDPFTVMTLNIHIDVAGKPNRWKDRRPRTKKMLERYGNGSGPHILGLQECYSGKLKELMDSISSWGYNYIFKPRGGPVGWNEGVALCWRTDRFTTDGNNATGEFKMAASTSRRKANCSWWMNWRKRNCVWARLKDNVTGYRFYVYNTHFEYGCRGRGCAKIMAEKIVQREEEFLPVIAMGDLNFGLDAHGQWSSGFQEMLQEIGLVSTYYFVHNFEIVRGIDEWSTSTGKYTNERNGSMIDHILTHPKFQVYDAGIDRTMFTDDGDPIHCPHISTNGNCMPTNYVADDLLMYSDHWAVWVDLIIGDSMIIGNTRTKEFHIDSCVWATRISERNKVEFPSIRIAIDQGFNGCYYCLYEYDTDHL